MKKWMVSMASPDLKSVIAKNIADLRKSSGWTQTELARKLNYSDKAISKWERAESMPDVTVLKDMADTFGVPIGYLLEAEHPAFSSAAAVPKHRARNRIIIALLSASAVFFIATVLYVVSGLFSLDTCEPSWLLYIYAIPPALAVLLVFNSIWGRKNLNLIIISLTLWSILLCIYVSFQSPNIWMVFLIGIPAQIIVMLAGTMKLSVLIPHRK